MPKSTSSSGTRARAVVNDGSTHQASAPTPARKPTALTITPSAALPALPAPPVGPIAVSAIIARITARSWMIRKPTAMRPCSASISRLSDSSLTMMIVLEKVRATAT